MSNSTDTCIWGMSCPVGRRGEDGAPWFGGTRRGRHGGPSEMRKLRRFRPDLWDTLEPRVVLSRGPGLSHALAATLGHGAPGHRQPAPRSLRLTPTEEINRQYDAFTA